MGGREEWKVRKNGRQGRVESGEEWEAGKSRKWGRIGGREEWKVRKNGRQGRVESRDEWEAGKSRK